MEVSTRDRTISLCHYHLLIMQTRLNNAEDVLLYIILIGKDILPGSVTPSGTHI